MQSHECCGGQAPHPQGTSRKRHNIYVLYVRHSEQSFVWREYVLDSFPLVKVKKFPNSHLLLRWGHRQMYKAALSWYEGAHNHGSPKRNRASANPYARQPKVSPVWFKGKASAAASKWLDAVADVTEGISSYTDLCNSHSALHRINSQFHFQTWHCSFNLFLGNSLPAIC